MRYSDTCQAQYWPSFGIGRCHGHHVVGSIWFLCRLLVLLGALVLNISCICLLFCYRGY